MFAARAAWVRARFAAAEMGDESVAKRDPEGVKSLDSRVSVSKRGGCGLRMGEKGRLRTLLERLRERWLGGEAEREALFST